MTEISEDAAWACDAGGGECGPVAGVLPNVTVVTDPLCSACWTFEPAWRRFGHHHGARFTLRHVYGVLVPGWDGFADPGAGIHGPGDVAGHWREVAAATGQPIDVSVWDTDPVSSTAPAVVALLRVRELAPDRESAYLRRLRELVLAEGRNIARATVLESAARDVGMAADTARAVADVDGIDALAATAGERHLMRALGARSFPTVIFHTGTDRLAIAGAVPYRRLVSALDAVAGPATTETVAPWPAEEPERRVANALAVYGRATTREVAELLQLPDAAAAAALTRVAVRPNGGLLWQRPTEPS